MIPIGKCIKCGHDLKWDRKNKVIFTLFPLSATCIHESEYPMEFIESWDAMGCKRPISMRYKRWVKVQGQATLGGYTTTQNEIIDFCDKIKDTLLTKNKEYGDSALNPIRLFSTADGTEQIRVRIDDKLSRITNRGHKNIKEDTLADLIGYLILLRIAEKRDKTRRLTARKNSGDCDARNSLLRG